MCTPDIRARRVITVDERHGVRSAGLSSEIKDIVKGNPRSWERRKSVDGGGIERAESGDQAKVWTLPGSDSG